MRLGVRSRILFWLAASVLPIILVGVISASVVEGRLASRVETELTNILRLESARIDRELTALTAHADDLAGRAGVQVLVEDAGRQPDSDGPLDALATDLVADASDGNHIAAAVMILAPDGRVLGASPGVDQLPGGDAFDLRFLPAYRSELGSDRLPVTTEIIGSDGAPIGCLIIDYHLASITDLLTTHDSFGDTSEAHVAQRTAAGDAAFITPLRFDPDAAFTKVVPGDVDAPINDALSGVGPTVVHAADYRQEPSVLAYETIEQTGWGLVVKIDQAEALGVTRSIRTMLLISIALMLLVVAGGWALVLQPLLRRLGTASAAAEKIADGDYRVPIDDDGDDEIAEMARSIDRLAAELSRDIAKRASAEAQLLHQATHDQLTGVSNRPYAERVLRSHLAGLAGPDAAGGHVSLLFLDLDGFKEINDTWGHGVGDEVLIEVASRLERSVPSNAMVARWGGDEFVVLLPGFDEEQAVDGARTVREAFTAPFRTSTGDHPLGASIGAATTDEPTSPDELIHLADGRMFSEKQHHRQARTLSSETARLVEAALAENRVEAWLQPIVSLEADGRGRYVGAEALARLRGADGLIIEAGNFFGELQHSRFARLLDMRIAELAIAELAGWRRTGIVDEAFLFAINLSPASLMHTNLASDLRSLLERYEVSPAQIVLELSEQLAEPNQANLATLRAEGFVLALDDFGLAHSNLDRLFSTGARVAKLDHRWSADDDVLAGLVRTCSAKGVELIVQGVETPEQAQQVLAHGVGFVQGFHFGRPQPSGMLAVVLSDLSQAADSARA